MQNYKNIFCSGNKNEEKSENRPFGVTTRAFLVLVEGFHSTHHGGMRCMRLQLLETGPKVMSGVQSMSVRGSGLFEDGLESEEAYKK